MRGQLSTWHPYQADTVLRLTITHCASDPQHYTLNRSQSMWSMRDVTRWLILQLELLHQMFTDWTGHNGMPVPRKNITKEHWWLYWKVRGTRCWRKAMRQEQVAMFAQMTLHGQCEEIRHMGFEVPWLRPILTLQEKWHDPRFHWKTLRSTSSCTTRKTTSEICCETRQCICTQQEAMQVAAELSMPNTSKH